MIRKANNRDPETYAVIGASMAVHSELGMGFLEIVYHEALAVELAFRGIPHDREVELPVHYRGQRLTCSYRADFVCYDAIIVEIKAQASLTGADDSQVLNYLKAAGMQRALLINFGGPRLEYKRIVMSAEAEDLPDGNP